MQEIILLTHKRGLEGGRAIGRGILGVGKSSRTRVRERALSDVEMLRRVVERDLMAVEKVTELAAARDAANGRGGRKEDEGGGERVGLGDGEAGGEGQGSERGGLRLSERAQADIRTLRKIAMGDINRLQMQAREADHRSFFG